MRFLALLAALAIVLLAAGCTTTAEPAPVAPAPTTAAVTDTPTPTPVPTTVATARPTTIPTARPDTLTVTVHSMTEYHTDNEYAAPTAGYAYLLVDFSIKNIGLPAGYSYNPNYVKVEDPDGYRYTYASHSFSVPGCFGMTTIPYGDTVRGKLLFEVPDKIVGTPYNLWVG